jgi:hypothetical protein
MKISNKLSAFLSILSILVLPCEASSPAGDTTRARIDSLRVLPSDFTIAGSRRYTIHGELPLKDSDIKPLNLGIMAGVYTGVFILQHDAQLATIWDEMGEFHFYEDGRYALWSDKAGHFFGSYFTSYLLSESLMTAGFSWDAATVWGGVFGLAYSTYVEVLDGFGAQWGFSPTDFYADVAGSALFVGQLYWPALQNFTPKFMYFPAEWYGEMSREPHHFFIDDYSSHTLWLSVNVHNFLPENAQPYWPEWLEISFGYAARNLCAPGYEGAECDPTRSEPLYPDVWGSPRYIVALDYNLIKLLPEGGNFWNWMRQTLNMFKWPSPAIEFGPTTRFFIVYPFPLEIGDIRL